MVLTFKKIHYRLRYFLGQRLFRDERGWNVNNDWRDGFLFVGNHLVLDFINTGPIMDGEPVELLPDASALARWLGAASLVNKSESARLMRRWSAPEFAAGVQELREFRERVRETVLKMEQGEQVSPGVLKSLNGLLVKYPDLEQVAEGEAGFEWRRHFAPEIPEHAFAPLADAFADLLTAIPVSRLRKCNSCVLHFYDTSKKGTRVWCSMNLCGNRAKVAAYADRQRGEAEKDTRTRPGRELSKRR
jgi:predicted RNA-binding Zn ribbon-like protein